MLVKGPRTVGFSIGYSYKKVTYYVFGKKYGSLMSINTLTPDKGLSRRERYDVIAEDMDKMGFMVPMYRPTKKEQNENTKRKPSSKLGKE